MVLILSRQSDYSTNKVIDWLSYYKVPFFRLNDEDLALGKIKVNFNLNNNTYFFKKNNQVIDISSINIVWFRKFGFLDMYEKFFKKQEPSSNLLKYTYSEFDKIRTLLISVLEDKKWLYFKDNMLSKVEVLRLAKKHGLKIPETVITNDHSFLNKTFTSNIEIITKSLGETCNIEYKKTTTPLLTQKFTSSELKEKKFFPSLFQEYIDKEYELRIFYLDGTFYPMAMFTQKNEKTVVDFRNYDFEKSPRCVPYKLPKSIEKKLDLLMKELEVNTGSFDMIKSVKGDYIFLEVNPCGQYGMTAFPCNYPIDRSIADYLKEHNF